jgi:hypothetical protein
LPAAAGCGSWRRSPPAPQLPATTLQHVVIIKLRQPSEADELIADTRRHLSAIPQVMDLRIGRPYDVGRPGVDLDWDVAVFMRFTDRKAYEAYLVHPEHLALVNSWQPYWQWIRVHDALDAEAPPPEPAPATPPGTPPAQPTPPESPPSAR